MIQCGDGASFAIESFTESLRRDLDCDAAMQPRVGGAYVNDVNVYRRYGLELLGPPLAVG